MSILEHVTNLEQSQALDEFAKRLERECVCSSYLRHSNPTVNAIERINCSICKGIGRVHPYPNGIGDWLASRPCRTCDGLGNHFIESSAHPKPCGKCHGTGHQSVWPSLVWWRWPAAPGARNPEWRVDMWHRARTMDEPADEFVHALDYLTAFQFFEECFHSRIVSF
mgnify:CR=1 FL=1